MMKSELGGDDIKVIATGGLSVLIASETDSIDYVDKFLTLEGLKPGEYRKLSIKEVKKLYALK